MFRWKLVPFSGMIQTSPKGIGEQNHFWKMKNKNEEKMGQEGKIFCVHFQVVEDKIMSAARTLFFLKACVSIIHTNAAF